MQNEKRKINNKSLPRKAKRSGGFTILESIVAIFILSLSIAGVFTAVQQSLSQAIIAKDEVRAFYLAQEAIEVIRNKRDQNQINRIRTGLGDWLTGIAEGSGDPCYFGKTCTIDVISTSPPTLVSCSGDINSCPKLKLDSSRYLYNYNTGSDTNINRSIQLEPISDDEISITVQVKWTKGISTYSFKAKTHLFNWI